MSLVVKGQHIFLLHVSNPFLNLKNMLCTFSQSRIKPITHSKNRLRIYLYVVFLKAYCIIYIFLSTAVC